MSEISIRHATADDLEPINELYNHYVETAPVTFDVQPISLEARRIWFRQFLPTGPHRLLVAVEADAILGYASSRRFREKEAYATSVETSVYCHADHLGRGAGSALYEQLFRELEGEDVHRAYAGITLPNPVSVGLHERFGFRRVALFSEVGRKRDRYWDVAWYEKRLGERGKS